MTKRTHSLHSAVRFTLPQGPALLRGVVERIDEAAGTADVRPLAYPGGMVVGAPVAEGVPMELVHVGDVVTLLLWGDEGAVVLGPYAASAPGAPATPTPWSWPVNGAARNEDLVAFTDAANWIAYPDLAVTLTVRETSYLWAWVAFSGELDAARTPQGYRWALHIDGVMERPFLRYGSPAANLRQTVAFGLRAASPVAPGSHTVDVRVILNTAGDTLSCRYAVLSVMALPD